MEPDYEVVILGGGPSGSLSAALLRRQVPGIRVLILEKAQFPRHHVGEVTLPGWHAVLERAGALQKLDDAMSIKKLGVIFSWGPEEAGETWTADFREEAFGAPAPASWHVDRAVLDQVLLDHAMSEGAEVRQQARVTAVSREPPFSVTFVDPEGEHVVTAAQVIDATGQARLLSRLWKLPLHGYDDMNNYAVYGYWTGSTLTPAQGIERDNERWAVVATCDEGWVWHIPIAPDVVSVGLVTTQETLKSVGGQLREAYLAAVRGTRGVGELLTDATYVGDEPAGGRGPDAVQVVRDWSYRSEVVCGPGWWLVGDAAVFVDPVLSSGLTLASNGASMVANAITTLADEAVDADLLRDSYARTYADISGSYHRMARVWYQRNLRAETWHWQARRERLRAGGEALVESDADAFTAVCLGAIASPLDAAAGHYSRDGWASEFFNWIVRDHLFSDDSGLFEGVSGGDAARRAGRRAIATRWRRLGRGRITLTRDDWAVREGYHTTRFMGHWQHIRYVELGEGSERLVFPSFDGLEASVFPRLDGSGATWQIVDELLREFALGDRERDRRIKGVTDTLLQLDMLGLLQVEEEAAAPPRLTGSPLLSLVVPAVLGSLEVPTEVAFEVDGLGEAVWVRTRTDGRTHVVRLLDGRRVPTASWMPRTGTTCAEWARGQDPAMDALVPQVLRRLQRLEQRHPEAAAALWSEMPGLLGLGLRFEHRPGERAAAERL